MVFLEKTKSRWYHYYIKESNKKTLVAKEIAQNQALETLADRIWQIILNNKLCKIYFDIINWNTLSDVFETLALNKDTLDAEIAAAEAAKVKEEDEDEF